jgi:hypothetical protein
MQRDIGARGCNACDGSSCTAAARSRGQVYRAAMQLHGAEGRCTGLQCCCTEQRAGVLGCTAAAWRRGQVYRAARQLRGAEGRCIGLHCSCTEQRAGVQGCTAAARSRRQVYWGALQLYGAGGRCTGLHCSCTEQVAGVLGCTAAARSRWQLYLTLQYRLIIRNILTMTAVPRVLRFQRNFGIIEATRHKLTLTSSLIPLILFTIYS